MKPKRRNFAPVDEVLEFNAQNRGMVERYYPHDNRYSLKQKFYLYINFGTPPSPESVSITFIYLNPNNANPPFNSFEYVRQEKIVFPPVEFGKRRSEKILPVDIIYGDLFLFKLVYQVTDFSKRSRLYISISGSHR